MALSVAFAAVALASACTGDGGDTPDAIDATLDPNTSDASAPEDTREDAEHPGDGDSDADGDRLDADGEASQEDVHETSADDVTEDSDADRINDGEDDGIGDVDRSDTDVPPPIVWPAPREGCNGSEALCDRPYDRVVFPGTHNSMSNEEDRWILPNQNRNLAAQLADGVRVFLLDVHPFRDDVYLCHSVCRAGRRLFLDAMQELASFLEANPREVVTLVIEDYVPAETMAEIMVSAGLAPYVYEHQGAWPTLREMIDDGTRLVVTAQDAGPPPTWMHNVWELGWDTPYSFDSVEAFSCRWNRGSSTDGVFLLNHWVLDPYARPETAVVSNARETLMQRVSDCEERWGRLPTWIAVDFYDIGDLFEVVDLLNERGHDTPTDGSLPQASR
jgi:hypothetical protein